MSRPRRGVGYAMEFKTQIGAVTARQAADELWKLVVSINGVLPPSMPLTLVYVRTGTNAGTTEELPATKDELHRRFPDIVSQVERYSERQDGRADLGSEHKPEVWRFHLYSRDGATLQGRRDAQWAELQGGHRRQVLVACVA